MERKYDRIKGVRIRETTLQAYNHVVEIGRQHREGVEFVRPIANHGDANTRRQWGNFDTDFVANASVRERYYVTDLFFSRHWSDKKLDQGKTGMAKRGLSPIYIRDADTDQLPLELPRRRQRLIAFGWYGGKFNHLDWLLPLLPAAHHYCEPFAGSASVLLNRIPAPVETYNDVDGEVVNFFRVLRDDPDELARVIALTPFSREEFHRAIKGIPSNASDLERARRFFIRARQARTGLAQTATLGRWANCKDTSRAGMSGVVSRWLGSAGTLPEIARRLLRVQIENRPALDVIRLYDGETTLFYCDPPYLHDTRGDSSAYGFEMEEVEHIELSNALKNCRGKAALSGYRNDLMDKLYKDWRRFDAPAKQCHSIKKLRQECLWMNY